jgi:hypothetical protein
MAKRALTRVFVPKTYAELRDAVLAVMHQGRREIEQAARRFLPAFHATGCDRQGGLATSPAAVAPPLTPRVHVNTFLP